MLSTMGFVRERRKPLIVAVEFAVKMAGPETVKESAAHDTTANVPLYAGETCVRITFADELPDVATCVVWYVIDPVVPDIVLVKTVNVPL